MKSPGTSQPIVPRDNWPHNSALRMAGRRRSSIFHHMMKLSQMASLASLSEAGAACGYEVYRRLDAGSFFGEQACLTGVQLNMVMSQQNRAGMWQQPHMRDLVEDLQSSCVMRPGEPRSASVRAATACDVYLLSRSALLAAVQDTPRAATMSGINLQWNAADDPGQPASSMAHMAHRTVCLTQRDAGNFDAPSGPAVFQSGVQDEGLVPAQSGHPLLGIGPGRAAAEQVHDCACAGATEQEVIADTGQPNSHPSRMRGSSLPMRNMLHALLELHPGEDLCEVQRPVGAAFGDAGVCTGLDERTDSPGC